MRRRRIPRRRRVPLLVPGVAAAVLGFGVTGAYTASNSVPSTNVGVYTAPIGAAQLAPAACTGTVTAIVSVPAGGALDTVSSGGNLILGTSGNDDVHATAGYNCFVGGGPAGANLDAFKGPGNGGDQCIIAASGGDPDPNVSRCTIVQQRP